MNLTENFKSAQTMDVHHISTKTIKFKTADELIN